MWESGPVVTAGTLGRFPCGFEHLIYLFFSLCTKRASNIFYTLRIKKLLGAGLVLSVYVECVETGSGFIKTIC